jgi:hypothetical protein
MKKDSGKNDYKKILPVLILVSVGLFFAWPLLGARFIPTHDGEYHIIRFLEFFRMLSAGYFFPRWAPTLNSGYGLPLFNFQYPFPNYPGSLFLALGLGAPNAFQVTLAVGYLFSGLASYFWLKSLFGGKAALAGALLGITVPYWFVDLFVRGSVGEIWAFGFVFAALWSIEMKKTYLAALSLGLLLVSHNILALIFLPFLLGYFLIRGGKLPWFAVWGVLLSAYFWVPALAEKSFVTGLNPVNFREHFAMLSDLLIPSWGTGFSGVGSSGNRMSFQIGIVPLFIYLLAFVFFIRKRFRKNKGLTGFFLAALIISLLLTLPVSRFVWDLVWPLALIQYPWRFLSFGVIATPFLFSDLVFSSKWQKLFWVVPVIGIFTVFQYTRPVTYEPRDSAYYLGRPNFTDGTNSLGNIFSTVWTPWISERAYSLIQPADNLKFQVLEDRYLYKRIRFELAAEQKVTAAVLYFPGWQVSVNGRKAVIDYSGGKISFIAPAGESEVVIRYTGTTIQKIAEAVSLITLVLVIAGIIIKDSYANRH